MRILRERGEETAAFCFPRSWLRSKFFIMVLEKCWEAGKTADTGRREGIKKSDIDIEKRKIKTVDIGKSDGDKRGR